MSSPFFLKVSFSRDQILAARHTQLKLICRDSSDTILWEPKELGTEPAVYYVEIHYSANLAKSLQKLFGGE